MTLCYVACTGFACYVFRLVPSIKPISVTKHSTKCVSQTICSHKCYRMCPPGLSKTSASVATNSASRVPQVTSAVTNVVRFFFPSSCSYASLPVRNIQHWSSYAAFGFASRYNIWLNNNLETWSIVLCWHVHRAHGHVRMLTCLWFTETYSAAVTQALLHAGILKLLTIYFCWNAPHVTPFKSKITTMRVNCSCSVQVCVFENPIQDLKRLRPYSPQTHLFSCNAQWLVYCTLILPSWHFYRFYFLPQSLQS